MKRPKTVESVARLSLGKTLLQPVIYDVQVGLERYQHDHDIMEYFFQLGG